MAALYTQVEERIVAWRDDLRVRPRNAGTYVRPRLHDALSASDVSSPAQELRDATLREVAGVERHFNFLKEVTRKHDWDEEPEFKKSLVDLIDDVDARLEDSRMFIGVVGEFSSGKTSFINALLREELLDTNVEQGTTTAITMIGHGRERDAEIISPGGARASFLCNELSPACQLLHFLSASRSNETLQLREYVRVHTAQEQSRKVARQLNLYAPMKTLQIGQVIVDTPGINSQNKRHDEVAASAVQEICDAVLIIIPAESAGAVTLTNFLNKHLSNSLDRCIFVLNKIDGVRPKERENVRSKLVARLESIGARQPKVLTAAPWAITSPEDLRRKKDRENLQEDFCATEEEILRFVREKKLVVVLQRLSSAFSGMFPRLQQRLERRKEAYQRRHRALEENRIPSLESFVEKKKSSIQTALSAGLDPLISTHRHECEDIRRRRSASIGARLRRCKDAEKLKTSVTKIPPDEFKKAQKEVKDLLVQTQDNMAAVLERHREAFAADFRKEYERVAAAGEGVLDAGELSSISGGQSMAIAAGDLDSIATQVEDQSNAEGWKALGGASVGAVIGTIVFPGVGSFIGGAIGGVISSIFGKSFEERIEEVLPKACKAFDQSFDKLVNVSVEQLSPISDSIKNAMGRTIDLYYAQYRTKVNALIAADEREKEKLEADSAIIEQDLMQLGASIQSIEQVEARLSGELSWLERTVASSRKAPGSAGKPPPLPAAALATPQAPAPSSAHAARTQKQHKMASLEKPPEVAFVDDDCGRFVHISLGQRAMGAKISATFQAAGAPVCGRGVFASPEGAFHLAADVRMPSEAELYIPHAALVLDKPGRDVELQLAIFTNHEGTVTPLGEVSVPMSWPADRGSHGMVSWLEPLVELCMMVVHADGIVHPQEIKIVRQFFERELLIPKDDLPALQAMMNHDPPQTPDLCVRDVIPRLGYDEMLVVEFLAAIAHSDDELAQSEVDVIRQVVQAMSLRARWPELEEAVRVNTPHYWSLVGLQESPDVQKVRAAYVRQ